MRRNDSWIEQALHGADLAAFDWNVADHAFTWSASAANVLGMRAEELPRTYEALKTHLDVEIAGILPELIVGSVGGASRDADEEAGDNGDDNGEDGGEDNRRNFALEYKFYPKGRDAGEAFWVRCEGRWEADADGRPVRIQGVMQRIDVEQRNHHLAQIASHHEAEGGLLNRCAFLGLLKEQLESATGANNMALLIISVRNLSVVADAYGFMAADAAYTEIGKRIKNVLRIGDPLARFGEGRFAVLLNNCSAEDLGPALRRLLTTPTSEVITTEHGPLWPMISIGAALLPEHANTLSNAIACAEEALSEAESRPSSNAVIFTPAPDRISRRVRNARRAHEILEALRENRFTIAFQPIVDSISGKPRYHEALLRMRNGAGEIVSAGDLIPLAEKLGLIHLLDLNVLDLVIQTLKKHPESMLSCNVSAITVMDRNWQQRLLDRLSGNEAHIRGRLLVEITESSVLSDLDVIQSFIEELHALGCKVAVDDFGAGYTSFRNLQALDFDVIKIDGAFCENLSDNPDHQQMVRSLIDLAHGTGMDIVAEWVGSEEDAALLREWGAHLFQGNLFGEAALDTPWPSPWLDGEWHEPVLPVRALRSPDVIRADVEKAQGEDEAKEAAPAEEVAPAKIAAEKTAAEKAAPMEEAVADKAAMAEAAAEEAPAADPLQLLEEQIARLQSCLGKMRGAKGEEKKPGRDEGEEETPGRAAAT